jgi:multiple sugar transport system permease protein
MAASWLSRRWRQAPAERRQLLTGLLFISPWLVGFALWTVYPLLASLYYSFNRYDIIRPPVFIGLQNYVDLFTTDTSFFTSVYNTVYYVGLGVPLGVATSFLMASLLNTRIIGRPIFRAIFFFPAIVPAVVIAMVWRFLLSTQYGVINGILKALELPVIPFLNSPELAKPSLILIYIWAQGYAIVIFLATLQDVPRELYEAAIVDGANAWHKFWNITIPMCTPVILFNLVTGFIYGFQEFTVTWLIGGANPGGPNQATEFYSLYLYRNAFVFLRMGKAAALAWILFIIILIFTFILVRTSRRWVYYASSED